MRGRTPGKRLIGVRARHAQWLSAFGRGLPGAQCVPARRQFSVRVRGGTRHFGSDARPVCASATSLPAHCWSMKIAKPLRTQHFGLPSRGTHVDGETVELVGELLDRWDRLDAGARRRIARTSLCARNPHRRVGQRDRRGLTSRAARSAHADGDVAIGRSASGITVERGHTGRARQFPTGSGPAGSGPARRAARTRRPVEGSTRTRPAAR